MESCATRSRGLWIAHHGRVIDKLQVEQYGFLYYDLVAAVRSAASSAGVSFVCSKVISVTTSDDVQTVHLADGGSIENRLIILANGSNRKLRRSLGMTHELVSAGHSVTLGFDVARRDGRPFDFEALTYFAQRPSDRMAYLTLFRIGARMRANLMTYRSPQDPFFEELRRTPEAVIATMMPSLIEITGDIVISSVTRPRPVDLFRTLNVRISEVVLVGDAFANSCPAAGHGVTKILNDVERLCDIHIPRWFSTPGMTGRKISEFYDDRLKTSVDSRCIGRASALRRVSIGTGPYWQAFRLLRYAVRSSKGRMRRMASTFTSSSRSVGSLPEGSASAQPLPSLPEGGFPAMPTLLVHASADVAVAEAGDGLNTGTVLP